MKYKVSAVSLATWNDKKYFKATLTDEKGEVFENIAFWNGEIGTEGANLEEVEGELAKNDKGYWKFTGAKKSTGGRPNMDRIVEKKAGLISEAQAKKAENIRDAQERSAWMWAKNNACELYANDRIGSKLDDEDEALSKILSFATKIYNGEPTEPF